MAKHLIDWNDDVTSDVLINPQLPEAHKKLLLEATLPHDLKGHIWIASSGTEGFAKMIALSKKAMLVSAAGVNAHLHATKEQPWLNVLPLFHVGGLGTHARALLSGASIYDYSENKWNAKDYVERLYYHRVAYSSLTPTQVYDIVQLQLKPPESLIAIIVGAGVLTQSLHEQAFKLGWPLLKSYGMTEACSQIATALHPNPKTHLVILHHMHLRFNKEDFIEIKSEALLTGFVKGNDPEKKLILPVIDGWYTTQDKGRIEADFLELYGRGANFLKIGGESINFSELEITWENIRTRHHCHEEAVIIDIPDERLGRIICLATAAPAGTSFETLIQEYNSQVIPLAKIRSVYNFPSLPRTPLFKLLKDQLREMIKQG